MIAHFRENLIFLFLVIVVILHKVCNKHIQLKDKLAITYIWLVSFLPFIFIPTEIEHILFENDTNSSEQNEPTLEAFWKIYYWTNFFNGWVFIPIWLGYLQSGYFKPLDKLADSIVFNLKYYLVLFGLLIGASVIVIFSYEKSTSQLFVESHLLINSMFIY